MLQGFFIVHSVPLLSSEVYAVIDLYGQCVQVSITSSSGPLDNSLCTCNITEKSFPIHSPGETNYSQMDDSEVFCTWDHVTNVLSVLCAVCAVAGVAHRLHSKHGKNVVLLGEDCQAVRVGGYSHGIVFSAKELKADELFEVRVTQPGAATVLQTALKYSGVLCCRDQYLFSGLVSSAGEDWWGGRAVEWFAAHRSDHALTSRAAFLSTVRAVALSPTSTHQGHLAAERLRGPSQRRAAASELRLFPGQADGELWPLLLEHKRLSGLQSS